MESNSRSATDMDDQAQYIDLKEISVDFIETSPTSDLELVFKDNAGVKYKSNKVKNGAPILWEPDIHVRTHTSATLIIRRALFKQRVAEISVKFEPYNLGDSRLSVWKVGSLAPSTVYFMLRGFTDTDRCVTVTFVYGKPKPVGLWLLPDARKPLNSSYSWQASLAFLAVGPPSQTSSSSNTVADFQKSSSECLS
ncbi:hypothetical protein EDB89DRAFT_2179334 [Lactarius sanguifluus]|nr:hypothetical protein EDB89DRAFT_2179334 [Lactarius sanguifluus]